MEFHISKKKLFNMKRRVWMSSVKCKWCRSESEKINIRNKEGKFML
jgi:hypothetical protein